jgi:nucleoside 2-deoxyribosyltransferase
MVESSMKYYIATKLSNAQAHNRLRDLLSEQGHHLTYDWTIHGPVWTEGYKRCQEVGEAELKGVADADFVIVMMPGGRGTHVELGAALILNKMVLFFSENEEDHQPISPHFSSFYAHSNVYHFRTVEDICKLTKTLNT